MNVPELTKIVAEALCGQSALNYADDTDLTEIVLDGRFNLESLAEAVLDALDQDKADVMSPDPEPTMAISITRLPTPANFDELKDMLASVECQVGDFRKGMDPELAGAVLHCLGLMGLAVVPVVPTGGMVFTTGAWVHPVTAEKVYSAMVEASPYTPPRGS